MSRAGRVSNMLNQAPRAQSQNSHTWSMWQPRSLGDGWVGGLIRGRVGGWGAVSAAHTVPSQTRSNMVKSG